MADKSESTFNINFSSTIEIVKCQTNFSTTSCITLEGVTKLKYRYLHSTYCSYNLLKVFIIISGVEIKYVVDFDPKLGEIIAETRYMEQLGYLVPEQCRNVALQVNWFQKQKIIF